eukprot:TRINITY_DN765_c0_g1_i1.p1 TRINITY_DN765_c0_g1~~TRINITY_DN765_c0_g1_i1.p1  ORF type:complete len:360 (+),score=114.20 TRINITY_DN765_c0_g1_i1:83-1162(+)
MDHCENENEIQFESGRNIKGVVVSAVRSVALFVCLTSTKMASKTEEKKLEEVTGDHHPHHTFEEKVAELSKDKIKIVIKENELDLEKTFLADALAEVTDVDDTLKCVDGRGIHAELGCPGGELGEFLCALTAYYALGGTRASSTQVDDMKSLLADYISSCPKSRLFYIHSGDHALHEMLHDLHLKEDHHFDMKKASTEMQSKILAAMDESKYYGCGHVKLQLDHPSEYGVEKNTIIRAFKAALLCLWDSKLASRMEFEVLTGNHIEKLVNIVTGSAKKVRKMIPCLDRKLSSFVYHPDAVASRRKTLAAFFAKQSFKSTVNEESLLKKIVEIGEQQLKATLGHLAKGLPVYEINVASVA